MSKPMWIAVGVAISLVGAIGVYALFTGKSAESGPHGGDIVPIDRGAGYAELVANAEHIRRELGWSPRYAELRPIVETAWNWHCTHPDGYGR